MTPRVDPERDLVLDRLLDLTRQRAWAAWTTPEHLSRWYAPPGWTVEDCELDLRPGGLFRVRLRTPEGTIEDRVACYLEVQPQSRLTWTDALTADFRPADHPFATWALAFQARAFQTALRVVVRHRSPEDRTRHEAEGFAETWGTRIDRLTVYMGAL